jgi:chromate transporter
MLELALLFLRLGATAFGGPAAHIALMEHELVRRRAWLTHEEFLDLVGATNLIPGPNSTELAIHIGYRRAGLPGLVVAGACFIVPAALLTAACAWAYVRWGTLPEVAFILYGVKPVIIAVVVQALVRLARTALRTWAIAALAALAAAAVALGVHELLVLLAAGLVCAALRRPPRAAPPAPPAAPPPAAAPLLFPALATATTATATATAAAASITLGGIFLVFLKIGSVLFGSGYVLLAFLRADLVERLGWLGEAQLLDAVAVGQITPGPVFSTATFIGYLLDGGAGAAVATVGIFLPAFVFVALSGPLVPRLRRSRVAGGFLDGVNAASLALMAVVAAQLGHAALVDVPTLLLAAVATGLLLETTLSSVWLVLGGALAGWALHAAGVA